MSYTQIESNLLNVLLRVRRNSPSKNSYGSLTESWSTLYDNIKGNIQSTTNREIISESGTHVIRTHIGFINSNSGGTALIVLEGDEILDKSTNLWYRVISAEINKIKTGQIHHLQLELEAIRQMPTRTQAESVTAKVNINV